MRKCILLLFALLVVLKGKAQEADLMESMGSCIAFIQNEEYESAFEIYDAIHPELAQGDAVDRFFDKYLCGYECAYQENIDDAIMAFTQAYKIDENEFDDLEDMLCEPYFDCMVMLANLYAAKEDLDRAEQILCHAYSKAYSSLETIPDGLESVMDNLILLYLNKEDFVLAKESCVVKIGLQIRSTEYGSIEDVEASDAIAYIKNECKEADESFRSGNYLNALIQYSNLVKICRGCNLPEYEYKLYDDIAEVLYYMEVGCPIC